MVSHSSLILEVAGRISESISISYLRIYPHHFQYPHPDPYPHQSMELPYPLMSFSGNASGPTYAPSNSPQAQLDHSEAIFLFNIVINLIIYLII